MRRVSASAFAILFFAGISTTASARVVTFTAHLSGQQEVPAVATHGKGTARATLNTKTKTLSWRLHYSGLSGPAIAAHIHAPAGPGQNAPVAVPLTGSLKSPIKGSAKLTGQQISEIEGGKAYFNIHTKKHPGGEIRGQIMSKH